MIDQSPLEARIGRLIAAYADRAPTDVDPRVMARLAASGPWRSSVFSPGIGRPGLLLGLVLLALALLIAIVGGSLLAGGRPAQHDLEEILTQRVAPFIGLPPEGAPPSTPEAGELVLSFYGRVQDIGLDLHRMWVYADGRLVWKRNLDGETRSGRLAFGATEPSTGVIEQRLTPEGVELIRRRVVAAGLPEVDPARVRASASTRWHHPGVLWGGLTVRQADGLEEADWFDVSLPGQLADPASWLPARAWEDRQVRGYVPTRYALCVEPSSAARAMPDTTQELIRSRSAPSADPRCPYQVSTTDARAIAATLDEAGLRGDASLRWPLPDPLPPSEDAWVELLPILPNGESVCNCG